MKRSEINRALREMEAMVKEYRFSLPPFCHFTPEEWASKGHEYDEIRHNMLGWDITDYGLGDFEKVGFSLITLRNGNLAMADRYPKTYAEKLLFLKEGQYSPNHFHWHKMEDIINRGGGILVMQLYCANEKDEQDLEKPVEIVSDGVKLTLPAGGILELKKGQSVTYTQRLYHEFWGKEGCGDVLIGEVSMCNDDDTDNHFLSVPGRFPAIEEDEAPYRLLCKEYPHA